MNNEFTTPPPTYSPQLGFDRYGNQTNIYMMGVPPPSPFQTPIMMTTTPPIMMNVPPPTPPPLSAASFIPQTAPGYCTPPMMMSVPPPMMYAPQPTAASFIPQTAPGYPPTYSTTSPGYGISSDLVIPFSTNTMVYTNNPYFK